MRIQSTESIWKKSVCGISVPFQKFQFFSLLRNFLFLGNVAHSCCLEAHIVEKNEHLITCIEPLLTNKTNNQLEDKQRKTKCVDGTRNGRRRRKEKRSIKWNIKFNCYLVYTWTHSTKKKVSLFLAINSLSFDGMFVPKKMNEMIKTGCFVHVCIAAGWRYVCWSKVMWSVAWLYQHERTHLICLFKYYHRFAWSQFTCANTMHLTLHSDWQK